MFDWYKFTDSDLLDNVLTKFGNYVFEPSIVSLYETFLKEYEVDKNYSINFYITQFKNKHKIETRKCEVFEEVLGVLMMIKSKVPMLTIDDMFKEFPVIKSTVQVHELHDLLCFYSAVKHIVKHMSFFCMKKQFVINVCGKFEPSMYHTYFVGGGQSYHVDVRGYMFLSLLKTDVPPKMVKDTILQSNLGPWPKRKVTNLNVSIYFALRKVNSNLIKSIYCFGGRIFFRCDEDKKRRTELLKRKESFDSEDMSLDSKSTKIEHLHENSVSPSFEVEEVDLLMQLLF